MGDIDFGFVEQCESEFLTNVYFPSKLGGKPAWLYLGQLPTNESLKCSNCNEQKSFLCQIYAPFDDVFNFHRMIYVFVCRTESCYISNNNCNITVLRSQLSINNEYFPDVPPPEKGDPIPEILPNKIKLCSACGCSGPLLCGRCGKASYCGKQHQKLDWPYHKLFCSVEKSCQAKPLYQPNLQIVFPEWEIVMYSVEDDHKNNKSEINESQELHKLEQLTAKGKAGVFQNLPEGELEKYTQGSGEVNDKHFQKFRNVCEKDPLQIIRYKRNGELLWISDPEITIKEQLQNIPSCELCGQQRIFEFQIMPQMLNYLKDSNIDWGIIAIYTCPNSCPLPKDTGYVKEFCIKQDVVNT